MPDYYVNTWNETGKLVAQVLVHSHAEGLKEKAAADKSHPYKQGFYTFICPVKLKTGLKGFVQQPLFTPEEITPPTAHD